MKMSPIIIAFYAIALIALADISIQERKKRGTYHATAQLKVVLQCIDQNGQVVSNVTVSSGVTLDGNPETSTQIKGKTDKNGCFVVNGRSNGELGYYCTKAGFYNTWETKHLAKFPEVFVSNGRWQPYGMINTVVLKRKINPVVMCVKSDRKEILPPIKNEYIGLDLEKGDWVKPYGKGIHADLNLKYEYESGTVPLLYYRAAVFFALTNKYDGAYVKKKDTFSLFKSVYQADTNAVYLQEFAFVYDRLSGEIKENSQLSEADYLIIRTRSKIDEDGNLISAHYTKIYGPITASDGGIHMGFYFNPKENDPNLEADTTKNLLNPRDLGFAP